MWLTHRKQISLPSFLLSVPTAFVLGIATGVLVCCLFVVVSLIMTKHFSQLRFVGSYNVAQESQTLIRSDK